MVLTLNAIRLLADESRELKQWAHSPGQFSLRDVHVFAQVIADFKRLHPGIEVVLLEGTDEEVE